MIAKTEKHVTSSWLPLRVYAWRTKDTIFGMFWKSYLSLLSMDNAHLLISDSFPKLYFLIE